MASSRKKEYPPLLPVGFHVMTVAEVRTLCVDRFPLSKKRDDIMTKLETVINKLRSEKIEGDIWVDGSFLTEKINPKDSDILLHVQADYYDNATTEQQQAIDWVNSNLKATHLCDSYVHFEYPVSSPWYSRGEWMKAY